MTSRIAPRSGGRQRHAFGFDRIMETPNHQHFRDWYARTSFFAPGFAPRRVELDATLSQPEAAFDKAA